MAVSGKNTGFNRFDWNLTALFQRGSLKVLRRTDSPCL